MKEIASYSAQKQEGILLNANELYQNLDEQILKEIQESIPAIAFHRYPDIENKELIQAYAKVIEVDAQHILAGNGSDEMLGLLIGYFLGKDKKLYTLDPDFSMYDYYASMHEAQIVKFPCAQDGSFSVAEFIEKGREQQVDMILFSNPNNPTGHALSTLEVEEIVMAFPSVPVIIDEAYGEFAQTSMLSKLADYQNLYVTRTLSKAYGLAGARLGFLLSNEKNIAALKPFVVPYNISVIASKVGVITLQYAQMFQPLIQQTIQLRDQLYEKIKGFSRVNFYPSQANYLYGTCEEKQQLLALFEKQQVIIRDYEGKNSFRITIGSVEQTALVLDILTAFEKEETACAV